MGLIIRLHSLNTTETSRSHDDSPLQNGSDKCNKKSLTSGKRSLKRREVKHGRGFSSPRLLLVKPAVQQTHRVWIRGGRGGGG